MRYKLRSVDELRVCGPPEMADLASSQTEVGRSASRQFRRLKSCEHSVHPLRGSKLVAAPDYEFGGREFESLRTRQMDQQLMSIFSLGKTC